MALVQGDCIVQFSISLKLSLFSELSCIIAVGSEHALTKLNTASTKNHNLSIIHPNLGDKN
ncbi:hypothetical protein PCIT_a0201 [Pseudoalteromonas citrea]|uniref:Uncharacterized protein n=1 Tax=Pseudoalteromonas citrea TaxID=43655 RepID=A0AAD4AKG5_9GAMM|nr:hypothetical protein PCIT_a0201 [Pseudoalteromonas citrea]